MSERMTRGYAIKQIQDYIERTYDPEMRSRIYSTIPAELRDALPTMTPTAWYPWDFSSAMWSAVASTGTDEKSMYTELVKCGESIAMEATNTFLRFLMKILTPALFAKKIADFWRRDNKGGEFSADVSAADQGRICMSLSGVKGYNHVGVASVGWITFGMKAVGKEPSVVQTGWTRENPGPDQIDYVVTFPV